MVYHFLLEYIMKNKTKIKIYALMIIVFAMIISAIPAKAAEPFTDVPKDHWAYDAIDKLIQNGYMDGFADDTFRGRKVVTRYEMALTLAKVLTKVEDVETAGGVISPKDAESIKNLANEFREELKSLGIKVNALDQRVTELEKFQKNSEKLRIYGYYKATTTFVWDKYTTKNDPDNGDDDFDAFDYDDAYDSGNDVNGMDQLRNKVNLKIAGKPFEGVETYLELKAWVNSYSQNSKKYTSQSKTVIRPYLEKYLIDYKTDRDIMTEKAHLSIKSQYANVRAFNNEDLTKLDDPVILLNRGGRNSTTNDRVDSAPSDVFSGIETKGTVKDVTYTTSVLKEYSNGDIYAGRAVYMVPKRILKTDTAEIIFGTSFVERANDYYKRGNFSEANGVDLGFKFTDIGTLKVTSEYLESRNGEDPLYGNGSTNIRRDHGTKLDAEYQLENMTLILNHYKYGKDFLITTARYDTLYTDTMYEKNTGGVHYNYGRDSLEGENFLKLDLKYDIPFAEDQKLKLEGIIQTKKWEYNPDKPHKTDGYTGKKFSFQADADMAKNMTSKFYTELLKDAFKDEVGETYTEVELNAKLNERISSTARFTTANNSDDVNLESKTNKENSFYGELSSQLMKNIWGKVFGKRTISRVGWHDGNTASPSKDNTEMLVDETGFETNFTLTSSLSLKLTLRGLHNVYNAYTTQNEKYNWFTSEFTEVFTDKLKGRLLYWWKNPQDHTGTSNDNLRNLTAELAYDPTDKTRMRVRYGDFIDNDQDKKNIETEKKVTFEATTDF